MKAFILAAIAALALGAGVANAALPHSQPSTERQNYMEGGGG